MKYNTGGNEAARLRIFNGPRLKYRLSQAVTFVSFREDYMPDQNNDNAPKKTSKGNIFKKPAFYIIAAAALLLTAGIVTTVMLLWNRDGEKREPGMKFYGFGDRVDYSVYLPESVSDEMLQKYGGIAFQQDKSVIYFDGSYHDLEGTVGEGKSVVTYDSGKMTVDCDLLKTATGIDAGSGSRDLYAFASTLGKEAFVYENKLCVLLDKGSGVNVFDNYYTFEMISLKIRKAPREDFENALMMLPETISNGSNYYVAYTDSDLELGLSTELYGLQGYGDSLDITKDMPLIVAGEGEYAANHTVVRVYNKYSAKTAQFLAFPQKVTGGVKVACAYVPYEGTNRGVIATAAFNGKYAEAKAVRVFDEYGILYMEVVPAFADGAPYNIVTGCFTGTGSEELLVTEAKAGEGGWTRYAIYSLVNGETLAEGSIGFGEAGGSKTFSATLYNGPDNDSVLFFDGEGKTGYLAFYKPGSGFSTSRVMNGGEIDVNGIYRSAFSMNGMVATVDVDALKAHRSFVKLFANTGDAYGTTVDVGVYENIFYWDTPVWNFRLKGLQKLNIQDTDYVKAATFQHIRTDLASKAIVSLTNQKKVKALAETRYSDWLSKDKIKDFSKSYNVWEPCFTHRFNVIAGTQTLAKTFDEQGFQKFLAYTNTNETANYVEIDSEFLNATYAEGLIELDKMRIYPLRGVLQDLYANFIETPEMLAGLEPIHEIEINVGETAGDYNPKNIEGFRSYLLWRFGSVEAINEKFGTSFSSRDDIDAPRNGALGDRGSWDLFKGKYFEQWSLFTRKIVNKRLTEAFREALLAGFPSEIVSGHSIPEGDAIAGLLGQADTRMSPVDAMMTLGCHFGATRYGVWFNDDNNFLNLAYLAGFKNITMGEYNSLVEEGSDISPEQLQYVWSHGSKYIHVLNVSDSGTRADLRALEALSQKNEPRPGYAEGTTASMAIDAGGKKYQIVELGGSDKNTGLLKSINSDGTWTGDVYIVPFHSHITVENLTFGTNPRAGSTSANIGGLQTGDIIEVNFIGSYTGSDTATFRVEIIEDEVVNERLSKTFTLSGESKPVRYVLSNQVPLGNVKVRISFGCEDYGAVRIESINGSVQRESVARKYFGDFTAEEHKGGVTFDILNRELVYAG